MGWGLDLYIYIEIEICMRNMLGPTIESLDPSQEVLTPSREIRLPGKSSRHIPDMISSLLDYIHSLSFYDVINERLFKAFCVLISKFQSPRP